MTDKNDNMQGTRRQTLQCIPTENSTRARKLALRQPLRSEVSAPNPMPRLIEKEEVRKLRIQQLQGDLIKLFQDAKQSGCCVEVGSRSSIPSPEPLNRKHTIRSNPSGGSSSRASPVPNLPTTFDKPDVNFAKSTSEWEIYKTISAFLPQRLTSSYLVKKSGSAKELDGNVTAHVSGKQSASRAFSRRWQHWVTAAWIMKPNTRVDLLDS